MSGVSQAAFRGRCANKLRRTRMHARSCSAPSRWALWLEVLFPPTEAATGKFSTTVRCGGFIPPTRQRMFQQPEGASRSCRVNASLLPTSHFITMAMQFAMVAAAKWHFVFVANLPTECLARDKAQIRQDCLATKSDWLTIAWDNWFLSMPL